MPAVAFRHAPRRVTEAECNTAPRGAHLRMQDATIVLVLGGITLCSIGLTAWLEHRFDQRETALRRKLGACRTSLEACEAERDGMRRQFNAQAVELARYRGQHAPHQRLTRVFTPGLPQPPDD